MRSRVLPEAQCELIAIDGASKERGEACLRIGREVRMQSTCRDGVAGDGRRKGKIAGGIGEIIIYSGGVIKSLPLITLFFNL